jgi:hypothetical protein
MPASPIVLSNPIWNSAQFQFVLNGQTNVSYILESSADLRIWTAVITNSDSQATRLVSLPASGSHGFWRVARVPGPLFVNAIAAWGSVTLGGADWVDGFDSADPNFSTNGQYDPAKRKAGGDIASATNSPGAVAVGNVQVAGMVHTAPGGSVTVGPNGGVGSIAYLNNPVYDGTIEPGYVRDDFNESFPDPRLPNPFGSLPPGPGVVNGTVYTYVLGEGDYRLGSLSLGIGQSMIITGKARIHITGTTTVSITASITIATNASVEWYAQSTVNIGGNGVVNVGGRAKDFSLIGLRTCGTITYNGTARFVGTVYAPFSAVSISGTADAIGAIVGRTFTLAGTMGFHFDENLKRSGPFF